MAPSRQGSGAIVTCCTVSGGFSCLDCRLGMWPAAGHYWGAAGHHWGVVIDGSLAEKFAMRNLHPATLPDEPEATGRQFVVNGSQALRQHVRGPPPGI